MSTLSIDYRNQHVKSYRRCGDQAQCRGLNQREVARQYQPGSRLGRGAPAAIESPIPSWTASLKRAASSWLTPWAIMPGRWLRSPDLTWAINSSSTQPPDTEPLTIPSPRTTSRAPGGRGALPQVCTTVTNMTRWPARCQASASPSTWRSRLSMSHASLKQTHGCMFRGGTMLFFEGRSRPWQKGKPL